MALSAYQRKRDFRKTAEPKGKRAKPRQDLHFVVQKHDASRLHYDFRLELDGVLLSWAIPKGPSTDPKDRRLAIQVEDHPMEYESFEGIIPAGQYGGGTVMVWDRGTWIPNGDPNKAYQKGHLTFELKGERLKGGWSLIRTQSGDGEKSQWLLIKRKDSEAAAKAIMEAHKKSVLSGRSMEAIQAGKDRDWTGRDVSLKPATKQSRNGKLTPPIPKARKAAMPRELHPKKATLSERVPAADGWYHEEKFDGYRILAFIQDGAIRLITRNGNDWTAKFATVREGLKRIKVKSAVLDGEVVALTKEGNPSFQALQASFEKKAQPASLAYYVFDLPYLDGYDLSESPLEKRKMALRKLLESAPKEGVVRYSEHVEGDGGAFFEFACRSNREGVISKKADSPYRQRRTRDWLKIKCSRRQEFVIGGFTDPAGSRTGFGALLLGVFDGGGKLHYCGRVGTGFSQEDLKRLGDRLGRLQRKEPPFENPPSSRGVHWVKPALVAEVQFAEWTQEGRLRHPSFKGLRSDKAPREIRAERSMTPPTTPGRHPSSKASPAMVDGSTVAGVSISNPDRMLFPELGLTKKDIADYFASVADWILPHVIHRPLMVLRCPKGLSEACFYQKHTGASLPDSVKEIAVKENSKRQKYIYIEDLKGLIGLVQMGTLEFHPWGSTVDRLESPDRIIFDIDPDEAVEWKSVTTAAQRLRELMEALGLRGFVRASGGKGLHVVFPISGTSSWESVRSFSGAIAKELSAAYPAEYVATMSKKARKGKIYLDWLRNARGATAIASYSVRARPGAPVAVALAWSELGPTQDLDRFTVTTIPRRLSTLKEDPWSEFLTCKQRLTRAALRAMRVSL